MGLVHIASNRELCFMIWLMVASLSATLPASINSPAAICAKVMGWNTTQLTSLTVLRGSGVAQATVTLHRLIPLNSSSGLVSFLGIF